MTGQTLVVDGGYMLGGFMRLFGTFICMAGLCGAQINKQRRTGWRAWGAAPAPGGESHAVH